MYFVRWIGNIAQNYQRSFAILMIGQVIFFVGLALFYLSAGQQTTKPLLAEFLVLLSIIILGIGVLVALVGYLALTYGRWYHFFRKPKKNTAFTKEEELDLIEPLVTKQATPAGQTQHNATSTAAAPTENLTDTLSETAHTESHINKE